MPSPLIGDEGMDYIALTCSRSGAYFLPRPRQDIGIDAHIEFRDEQCHPTGAIAFIQSKAGLSYISPSGKYRILADKSHFQIWSQYSLPVIGIIYNPEARDARWVNISAYLKVNPACIENGPYVIEAPAHQLFSEQTFSEFQKVIERLHMLLGPKAPHELINRYLIGDDTAKDEALTELFSEYREMPLVCFFLHQVIRLENSQSVISYLTYLMNFYRSQSVNYYGLDNTDSKELKELAMKCIKDFDTPEIVKMLSTVDEENGIHHWTTHVLAAQLEAIDGITAKLRSVAGNRGLNTSARFYAIGILLEYLEYKDRQFFETLSETEQDYLVFELLQWYLDNKL